MTRSELIQRLAEKFPQLTIADAEMSVKAIIDGISNMLAQSGRVEIRGFGTFRLNYKPPRKGRNPKTGKWVDVPEKYAPHFKAGSILRDVVNSDKK